MDVKVIKFSVDGKCVNSLELQMAIKYIFRHRRLYHSKDDVRVALERYIREIRRDVNNA